MGLCSSSWTEIILKAQSRKQQWLIILSLRLWQIACDKLLRLVLHPERTENRFMSSITLKPVFLPVDSLVEGFFLIFCETDGIALLFNKMVSKITWGFGKKCFSLPKASNHPKGQLQPLPWTYFWSKKQKQKQIRSL